MYRGKFDRGPDAPAGDDLMLMFFTSGTTGYPKIAAHEPELVVPLEHQHHPVPPLDAQGLEVVSRPGGGPGDVLKGEAALGLVPVQVEHGQLLRVFGRNGVHAVKGEVEPVRVGEGEGLEHAPLILHIANLAPLFRNKLAEPYYCTYDYDETQQRMPIHLTTHAGQEFDIILSGQMKVQVGDHTEILREGDRRRRPRRPGIPPQWCPSSGPSPPP